MKKINYLFQNIPALLLLMLCTVSHPVSAQDSTAGTSSKAVAKPVKNTFESNWIFDNQTVMVPKKGTFEMDIQHRFGTVNNGYSDLFGIYAPSNIRIGFSYVIKTNLQLGMGFCKEKLQWDANVKYAIIKQKSTGGSPVSITYFGNLVVDTRKENNFVTSTDRLSYFNQLMIARKISSKISVQAAPSLSYFNNVPGYTDSKGNILPQMNNAHFALALMGRYKIGSTTALVVNYDQPLTQHPANNPHPSICFGLEMTTSAHAFQIFAGNYNSILPQNNNMFNQNDYTQGQFLIGFNITRLWSF
ncbi:MAG: DUF5777 family beta-barrel protein [Bacteroidota bacterium]